MRGKITPQIQDIAKKMIGRTISTNELRLMAYVDYVMKNNQKIEPIHINGEERIILQEWREAGFIEGGASGLSITKQFYDLMCAVLWEGYVVGGATD